jgi:hypothetical protein
MANHNDYEGFAFAYETNAWTPPIRTDGFFAISGAFSDITA